METRRLENESLLHDDAVIPSDQSQDMLALLPTDLQKYLLGFCALSEIGSLAQVNQKWHHIINDKHFTKTYEVRSYFTPFIPIFENGREIRSKPGYLTGSYAQLRNFFAERNRDKQRVAEVDASCCMKRPEACEILSTFLCLFGASGSFFGTGLGTFLYFVAGLEQAATTAVITAPFCLIAGCGMVCKCADNHIEHQRQTRNELQSHLYDAPNPARLHGTTFNWNPTAKHADYAPVKLGMHE
jgi:hypothetical protein